MPIKATYTIFPRLRSKSYEHDIKHKSILDTPRQPHLPSSLNHKQSDTASTKLQELRLFVFPSATTSNSTGFQNNTFPLPPQPSPGTLISPLTLSTTAFANPASTATNLAVPKNGITILDVSTLNETGNHDARYKGTAIIPRQRRPILRLFSRGDAQRTSTTKRAARLFRDFSFPADGDDKENATYNNVWEDGMVSPKNVDIATFGYGRIENVVGRDGQEMRVVMEQRSRAEVDVPWSGGRKRSWEEYDADDEIEERDVFGDMEARDGGVRV